MCNFLSFVELKQGQFEELYHLLFVITVNGDSSFQPSEVNEYALVILARARLTSGLNATRDGRHHVAKRQEGFGRRHVIWGTETS